METNNPCDVILDTALQMAEQCHWESIRLADVAQACDKTLSEIHCCYRQKDDLVEALFDRADIAMLEACRNHDLQVMSMKERLHFAIMAWLDSLAPYKKTVRQMMYYKLEPGHVHLQVLGVLRISRTVQWIQEAVNCKATNARRIIEEVTLSSIYLMACTYWIFDSSEEQSNTRKRLDKLLGRAENVATMLRSQ